MNTSQNSNRTTRTTRTVFSSLVVTAVTAAVMASPAAARQDRGESAPAARTTQSWQHPLQRVGTEFVRGDDLTGNGVSAPGWVDQR